MEDDDDMIRELHRRLAEAAEYTDALEADNEVIRARVAELESAQIVKPIDDAPRDGTEISGLCRVTCKWSVKLRMWWTDIPSVLHPEYFISPDQSVEEKS